MQKFWKWTLSFGILVLFTTVVISNFSSSNVAYAKAVGSLEGKFNQPGYDPGHYVELTSGRGLFVNQMLCTITMQELSELETKYHVHVQTVRVGRQEIEIVTVPGRITQQQLNQILGPKNHCTIVRHQNILFFFLTPSVS